MEPRPGLTVQELLNLITPRAWVTPTIAVGLVGCFIAAAIFGVSPMNPTTRQLLDVGADFGPYVAEGQWWRLITATLLHAGLIHLAFNLWAFWNSGQFAERLFGNWAFLALYVFSAVGGELASLMWNPVAVGVGASGAVFGVFGALLAFMVFHRGVLPDEFLRAQRSSLLGFIAYNVVFSFLQPQINIAAHAGGLATGFVCGAMLSRDLLKPADDRLGRALRAAAIALMLAMGGVAVQKRLAAVPDIKASNLAGRAYDALTAKHLSEAIALYSQALELRPEHSWRFNRALAELENGDSSAGLKDLRECNAQEPTELSRAMLCEVSARNGNDWGQAERDCDAAISANPKDAASLANRGIAHFEQHHLEAALADAEASLQLDPVQATALHLRLSVRLAKNQPADAGDDCQRLLEQPRPSVATLRLCARVAKAQRDQPRALSLLDQALALEPDDVLSLVSRALALQAQGEEVRAMADYDRALTLAPELGEGHNNRAWLKVLQGDFEGAVAGSDRAVALSPHSAAAAGTHCFALAGANRLDDALLECRRAVQLEGETVQPIDAGLLAFLEHRPDEARRQWERALAESPDDRRAFEPYLKQLRKP